MDVGTLRERLQAALGSQFTVGSLLGQGGFAMVYRARDHALNRDVAVKVMDTAGAASPTLAERFVREAQTIARLEHPNIVPIYEVGQPQDLLYIIMRCVDGPSLRQLLATSPNHRLSLGDAARVARQVADALAYAHTEGVVHRDVKPDNILLDRRGQVLVSDFGIAKAAQAATAAQLTTEGMIIGTPQYMSPEQAAGDAVDGRSDIYALGIVLYQMLAGAPPFDGDSSAKIIAQQLTTPVPDIRRLRPDVPPEVGEVLARMLAKHPTDRFQSAGEVSRSLVAALPTAAHGRIRPRRHRLLTMLLRSLVGVSLAGCLAAVAFVAGGVVVLWFVVSAPAWVTSGGDVPDTLRQRLEASGVIGGGDRVALAFHPGDRGDSIVLVVGTHRAAVLTPHRMRTFARDSITSVFGTVWRGGPSVVYALRMPDGRQDTVYADLSVRAAWALQRRVEQLLPDKKR